MQEQEHESGAKEFDERPVFEMKEERKDIKRKIRAR